MKNEKICKEGSEIIVPTINIMFLQNKIPDIMLQFFAVKAKKTNINAIIDHSFTTRLFSLICLISVKQIEIIENDYMGRKIH